MAFTPIRAFFAVLVTLLCNSIALAAIIDLPRIDGEVVIDGHLDEDVWRDAAEVQLVFETQPGENTPARVKTVGYMMEDGVNLYVGFAASDPDPSAIRAYLRDRDSAYDDDYVGIIIDTYNDGRRAVEFLATPLGVQMDVTVDEARQGDGGKEDDSWDAIWESAGHINAEGYTVEMKVPLNQLRFPAGAGLKTWGFDLYRSYPREKKFASSNNALARGNNCYLCQIGKLSGLKDVEPGRNLEVVPTVTASRSDSSEEPGVDPLISGGTEAEAGLSLRWGITPDLTANLAINPDFSQVEADAAQLDVNNRFALFYPEKRPVFLEGADYFSTPIRAVFTRTIASPDVGVKLTGKRGDHTFGMLVAEDAVTNLLFPGAFGSDSTTLEQANTALVGRYSRSFGETSSIGGVLTIRDGDDYHNYVGGFDARWKINEQHTLSAQYLESETEYPAEIALEFEQPNDPFDGDATLARYEYDSRNWFSNIRYARQSEGFRADSGFQNRVGDELITVNGGRVWHGVDGNWWSKIVLFAEYDIGHLEDGTFREKDQVLRLRIEGPLQSRTNLTFRARSEYENGVLFDLERYGVFSEVTPRRGLRLMIAGRYGDQIDYDNTRMGVEKVLEPAVNWNINRNLLLRLQSVFARLDTKEGERIFNATVIDARLTWQFNVRSFLRMTLQQSETSRNPDVYLDAVDAETRDVGRQLLYSYKINPQTVFFLGYSDQYVDDDNLDRLTAADRSLFMKIGYAWNL